MRVLVVFHDHGGHPLDRWLREGYRHCFAVVETGRYMVRIDGMNGVPVLDVVCEASYDLAAFYRKEGFTVVETTQNERPIFWPLVLTNCVGVVKSVLAMSGFGPVTPYGLYRRLRVSGSLLPGKSLFSPPKPPPLPPLPEAPPLPPERDANFLTAVKNKVRKKELAKRGRSASILTGASGVTAAAPLGRPTAGSGDTLG